MWYQVILTEQQRDFLQDHLFLQFLAEDSKPCSKTTEIIVEKIITNLQEAEEV